MGNVRHAMVSHSSVSEIQANLTWEGGFKQQLEAKYPMSCVSQEERITTFLSNYGTASHNNVAQCWAQTAKRVTICLKVKPENPTILYSLTNYIIFSNNKER